MDNTATDENTYTLQSEIYQEMNDDEEYSSSNDDDGTTAVKSKLFYNM